LFLKDTYVYAITHTNVTEHFTAGTFNWLYPAENTTFQYFAYCVSSSVTYIMY